MKVVLALIGRGAAAARSATRWSLLSTVVLLTSLAVAMPSPVAASPSDPLAGSCVRSVSATTLLSVSTKLSQGAVAHLPLGAIPRTSRAAVVQVIEKNASATSQLLVAPTGTTGQAVVGVAALKGKPASATVLVPNPGTGLDVWLSTGSANIGVDLVGYVDDLPCFTPAAERTPITTGALSAGTSQLVIPHDESLPTAISLRVHGGATAGEVVLADSSDGHTVVDRRVAVGDDSVDLEVLPPSSTTTYTITVTGGIASMSIVPIGSFVNAQGYAGGSTLMLDTLRGVGAPKKVLSGRTVLTVPLPADAGAQAASAVLRADITPYANSEVRVWTAGGLAPKQATIEALSRTATSQLVLLQPGPNAAVSVSVLSGKADVALTFVGWSPIPPPVNEPVAALTHTPDATSVTSAAVDPSTGAATIVYTGTDPVNAGDFVVVPPTNDAPDGYLGTVTGVQSTTTTAAAAAHDALYQTNANGDTTSSGDLTVTMDAASLPDVIPQADFSQDVSVASDPAPPVDDQPLPPDPPPPASSATGIPILAASWLGVTAATPVAKQSTTANRTAFSPSTASGTGGALPSGGLLSCSGGVAVNMQASLGLNTSVNFTGSWSIFHRDPTLDLSFNGGVSGSLSASAAAAATCGVSRTFQGPSLPTLRFAVGAIPVWITPQLSMTASLSGHIDGSIKATTTANLGAQIGIHYQGGTFTPYIHNASGISTRVDARASAGINASVLPRLDLKLYGVAGPFVEIGPTASISVNPFSNPWWTAQVGVHARVGVTIDTWFLKRSWTGASWDFGLSNGSGTGGAYPGPTITTGSLPNGTVGSGYGTQLGASGGSSPLKWYLVSGRLPSGLFLSSNGSITGTPSTTDSQTFTVRSIDGAGYRSVADRTLSIQIGSQPPPSSTSVTLTKGGHVTVSGCTSSACAYMVVTLSNFGSGSHTVGCYSDDPYPYDPYHAWYTYTTSSTTSAVCVYGWPGYHAWVVVDGVESNHLQW
jgi:hypothetical protein